MLNGVNPVVIEKCTALPPNFPVTNELVQPFLTRGLTLEQEMEVRSVCVVGGRRDGQTDGWMDGRTDGQTDGWTDGRVNGWMDRRTDGRRGRVGGH